MERNLNDKNITVEQLFNCRGYKNDLTGEKFIQGKLLVKGIHPEYTMQEFMVQGGGCIVFLEDDEKIQFETEDGIRGAYRGMIVFDPEGKGIVFY